MRFREDNPEDLDRARTAVAQWREQNPAGTQDQLLTALSPQFHPDYAPVLRAVLFTHDRQQTPIPPQTREEHPGGPQDRPEPADTR
jgi:hypothetical protein